MRCKEVFSVSTAVPDAPEAPQAADITATSCTVTWQPPANDGGAPVLGYHLERQSSFSPRWARANKDLIEGTTFDLTDLVEDNTYTFRIIAENKAGPSNPSLPSETIKAKNPWSKYFVSFFETVFSFIFLYLDSRVTGLILWS